MCLGIVPVSNIRVQDLQTLLESVPDHAFKVASDLLILFVIDSLSLVRSHHGFAFEEIHDPVVSRFKNSSTLVFL